jgi:hypothetical protein
LSEDKIRNGSVICTLTMIDSIPENYGKNKM